jgi:hypothetical protein
MLVAICLPWEGSSPVVGEHDSPAQTAAPVRTREKRAVKAVAGLSVVVLGVLGFASYELVNNAGHSGKPSAGAAAGGPGQSNAAARTSAAQTAGTPGAQSPSSSAPSSAASSPSASAVSASASPSVTAAQTLGPVSAAAFGPAGTSDGDGTAQAGLVIDRNPGTYWRSDWYSTAHFGALQPGTGLLIDMGRTDTITGVRVVMGTAVGADLGVLAGNRASLASLTRVAASAGAGGTVQFKPTSPAHARYVLLWFTALPPDGVGTYQAQVNEVTITGQP